MTKKQKLFAWDFHGTLEQGTEVGFAQILRDLANKIGYGTRIELEKVRKLFGISVLDYLKHFFPKLSEKELIRLRKMIRTKQNRKHIADNIRAAPHAHLVLQKIKMAGHKSIIISTSSNKHIRRFLDVLGILEYFDAIYGVDRHYLDTHFDIAQEKAKAIEKFAKRHKIAKHSIIVIGDRPGDIDAGILIGAKTYQYINPDFPNVTTKANYKIYDLRKILREI